MTAAPTPKLRVLDDAAVARELDLVSELFHRVNRVIPEDQELLTVPASVRAREAIALMNQYGYSQVPVVDKRGEVLGLFSFRSFAKKATNTLEAITQERCAPGDLCVDDCPDRYTFASVKDETAGVFDAVRRDGCVLVGTPERPLGIVTPDDVLRYLEQVASPFVLVSEIELALRALIGNALDETQIAMAASRSLSAKYRDGSLPTTLQQMSLEDYRTLIAHGESWPTLEPVFGGTRTRTSGKLKEVGDIRNQLFHFREPLQLREHETLVEVRNWLLSKTKQVQARGFVGTAR